MTSASSAFIINQNSIGVERLCCNGVPKDVHVVAKTLPFTMECSFPLPLNRCKIEAALYYDVDGSLVSKLVTSPKGEAMEAKMFVNSIGSRVTTECRFHVLTSQHNESLFRVKVTATLLSDPNSSLFVLSSPIWVVSKHSQATKLLYKKKAIAISSMSSNEPANPVNSPPVSNPCPSVPSDLVLQTLERLEKRQMEQQKQINLFLSNFTTVEPVPDPIEDDFDVAFHHLLAAYSNLSQEQRSNKMRKISTSDFFPQFLEICTTVTESAPIPEIPYDEWESYYNDIFTSPDTTPEM